MTRSAQFRRILNGTYAELQASDAFPQVGKPDDVTDAALFPRIASITRERDRMTPEQRKALNAGWPEDWA